MKQHVATKPAREAAAVKQLDNRMGRLSEAATFTRGYMDKIDDEAKFVYAVDKLLPLIMVELAEPKVLWRKKGVTMAMEP